MSVEITVADVIAFYPQAANVDSDVVQMYIDIIDEADECLVDCGVSDAVAKALKLNAVSYLLYASGAYSGVSSMRSPTGESVSFSNSGGGLEGNQYGRNILMLDKCRCIIDLLENPQNERFFVSVGGDC